MKPTSLVPFLLVILALASACGPAPASEGPPSYESEETASGGSVVVGPLSFDVPSDWRQEAPSSSMRAAQFAIGGDGTSLVVFFFGVGGGGSVEDNLTRWIGQMSQPDGSPSEALAERSSDARDGMTFHHVDVTGTYDGGMSGDGGPGWRLLGTIVECPGGPYFFKLTGPAATVESARAGYDALISSMAVRG